MDETQDRMDGPDGSAQDPLFSSYMEMLNRAREAWFRGVDEPEEEEAAEEEGQRPPDAAALSFRASFEIMASGFRSWKRAADVWAAHAPSLYRDMTLAGSNQDADARLRIYREMAAAMREAVDGAWEESRQLLSDLEGIFMAGAAPPASERNGEYWRRHRAKL
jgi:hypothetical protein